VFSDLFELHKVFVEHPEMRPYFYDKKGLLETDAEFQRGRAIAEMFFDAFIHMFEQRHAFPKRQQRLLDAYLADILSRSEFLLQYLYENIKLLDPIELRQQVKQMHANKSLKK
jgi:hypothetical protein